MVGDAQRQFRERVRELVASRSEGERMGGSIYREKIEEIGASLGMGEALACALFLSMQGRVWRFAHGTLADNKVPTPAGGPYPRNWFLLTSVVLA